jgi:hypothetical protein
MDMVGNRQRIASAFTVLFGPYGAVTAQAHARGVCRQRLYREAAHVLVTLDRQPGRPANDPLRQQVQDLQEQVHTLQRRLAQAVVLDADKQAEMATVAQAVGVSLPHCRTLLQVLIPDPLSVATLGRRTQEAGTKAGALLAVLDEVTQPRVRQAAADEIYVRAPVLMVVEPESLCWVSGRVRDQVDGPAWAKELGQLPHLEEVMRDGGKGLEKGVALVNAQRQEHAQARVVDQGDHFHATRGSGVGLRKREAAARQALADVERAEKELQASQRQGHKLTGPTLRLRAALRRAEAALDAWSAAERAWQQTKEALHLVTAAGTLNTRAQATAVLAETLPQLPDDGFGKVKRLVQKPEMLNFLDQVQQKLQALPYPDEVKQAAVRQECLRRRPELLRGEGRRAAALRGVLLTCAVVLSKAGAAGQHAGAAVQDILRRAYRASSLVECINSVLRMQQASHRKLTQGLLDLKRLYWNCHTFRTGRRRKTTPYQRLGVPWPEGLHWWDLFKLTPEQLRDKLSATATAP